MEAEKGGHFERCGWKKLGSPAGFHFYRWESVGDGTLLTGGVVTRLKARGKNIGKPVYEGEKLRVFVSEADAANERRLYEAETGHCGGCLGSGKRAHSWHHLNGWTYRECHECRGSGRLAQLQADDAVAGTVDQSQADHSREEI